MKIIAAVEADLDTSPIGTPSRLADDLAGQPVIRRTISRLTAARRQPAQYFFRVVHRRVPRWEWQNSPPPKWNFADSA